MKKEKLEELTEALMSEAPEESSTSPKEQFRQAQILVRFVSEDDLFHTPEGQGFVHFRAAANQEVLMIHSKSFRLWLVRQFYREQSTPPSSQALQSALGVLEARAVFDGPEAELFVRVAEHAGRIYIDLCNTKREVVEITPQNWRIITDPPVHFRRPKGMRPLPRPVAGGSMALLRSLINVGDDDNWILCACWLVFACRGRGPYPVLIIQGEQGAAKSTMEKILRRLIDPSVALVRTPPKDEHDLLIAASNSHVVAYDNLSGIQHWLSDALCRIATGSGFSTRQLYTDADEIFFEASRPVILNGIDHLAERADLADRAINLSLPSIEEHNRKDEAQVYKEFERNHAQILGALFTAVSRALQRLPHTRLEKPPRMADFALFATAAEEALGFPPGAFMRAYSGNREELVSETLQADPVGAAILAMMENLKDQGRPEYWNGACGELLRELESLIDENTKKSRVWPNARGLSSRLRRLATFFRTSGMQITFHGKGSRGQRLLTIEGIMGGTTASTATCATTGGDCELDQSVRFDPHGGGPATRVAVGSPTVIGPPQRQGYDNPLNLNRTVVGTAQVAVEAVPRRPNPVGPRDDSATTK